MKIPARFLKSKGWLVEIAAAHMLTIGLIVGRKPDSGAMGEVFGYPIRWIEQAGFNLQNDDTFLLLLFLCNLLLFVVVSCAFREEIGQLTRLMTSVLGRMPKSGRHTMIHSLLVTATLAGIFSIVAATGDVLGDWISKTAVVISGREDFDVLRVPICFSLAYPFCQWAIAASRIAKVYRNHDRDFFGG